MRHDVQCQEKWPLMTHQVLPYNRRTCRQAVSDTDPAVHRLAMARSPPDTWQKLVRALCETLMKIFFIRISILIVSLGLSLFVELQFLDWPFSGENNRLVFTAGVIIGLISLLPLIGVEEGSLRKRALISLFLSILSAFFYYVFNLVLFTV